MEEVDSITSRYIIDNSSTEILDQWPNTTSSIQTCIILVPVSGDIVFYFTIIMDIIVSFILGLAGIVLNILILIILRGHGSKDTTTILLLSMAVTDLVLSIMALFNPVASLFGPSVTASIGAINLVYVNNLRNVLAIIKLWHALLIAIERFLAVSFPFHVASLWTKLRVKCSILFIYFTVCSIDSFYYFLYQLTWRDDVNPNYSVAAVTISRLYRENYRTILVVYFIAISHFVSSFAMVIIFLCCAVVIWKLFVRSRYLHKLSASKNSLVYVQKVRPFKMLLAVCSVTLVMCTPTNIWYAINASLDSTYCISQEATNIFFTVNFFSFQTGACSNFFIYVTMQSKFASKFKSIFRCVNPNKEVFFND